MTDKSIDISFNISNLVERLSSPLDMMVGGKQPKVPMPKGQGSGAAPPTAIPATTSGPATISTPTMIVTTPMTSNAPTTTDVVGKSRQTSLDGFITTTPAKRARAPNTPEDNHAKRAAHEEEEDGEWQQTLRSNIMNEVGLSAEQVEKVMKIVMEAFKAQVVRESKRVALQTVHEDYEVRRSGNSIIIHRADQWVSTESGPYGLNLAEKVTMAIHNMTGGAVAVLDSFALGRWDAESPSSAVMVTFGSRTQKSTFFKILAKKVSQDAALRVISCRDAFPKKHIQAAKEVAKKGNYLKSQGSVAAFRVVARGNGCLPILEVKGYEDGGRREARWRVYTEEGLPQRDRRERRLQAAGTGPATPRKAGGSLSIHPQAVEMEDADEIVRLDVSEEYYYQEKY